MQDELTRDVEERATPGGEDGVARAFDSGWRFRVAAVVAAVLIALCSFFPLGNFLSSPAAYEGTISSLDAKKDTVMTLVAASAATSAAVTLLPGDAGTPIAEKLIDLSSDFLIVITALYLEKYLLTILGFAAYKILVPLGCALVVAAILMRRRFGLRAVLAKLAAKLVVLGVALSVVVPVSVGVSNMIEATYASSINDTIAVAEQTVADAQDSVQDSGEGDGGASGRETADGQGLLGFLRSIPETIENIPDTVSRGLSDLTADAQEALNGFIEALAIMVVTSCVIPVLVLVFFLWIVKLILGISIDVPAGVLKPHVLRRFSR